MDRVQRNKGVAVYGKQPCDNVQARMKKGKTMNITDINANRPHKVSEVICVNCCKRWIAVRPTRTLLKDLECPKCHEQGNVIETGEILEDEE